MSPYRTPDPPPPEPKPPWELSPEAKIALSIAAVGPGLFLSLFLAGCVWDTLVRWGVDKGTASLAVVLTLGSTTIATVFYFLEKAER